MNWLFGSSEAQSSDSGLSAELSGSAPQTSNRSIPEGSFKPASQDNSKWKESGNAAFKDRNFELAIELYSAGIDHEPSAVLFSNRSAAFAAIGKWKEALEDAERAIGQDPGWAKGYSRKGKALYALGRYKAAAEAFSKGLELSLVGAQDEVRRHDVEISAVKRQTDNQASEFLRLLEENKRLQVEDYELMFGDWAKKQT